MGLISGLATSHVPCCLLLSQPNTFEEQPERIRIANSGGQAAARQNPDMATQSQSTALPQAGAFPTKSSFRHSFACSFFPRGANPSRGPGISCLTWTCSRQQLQTEERSLAFPTLPQCQRSPSAACMSPTAPQPDTGRAPGSPNGQAGGTFPCTEQLAAPCFLPS